MAYSCKILADSSDGRGNRLVTYEIVFPRAVLAEYNTHCMLARNSASSRAIPVGKMIRALLADTFVPQRFGINQAGMQSAYFLEGVQDEDARFIWNLGRDRALLTAVELLFGLQRADQLFGRIPDFDDPSTRELLFVSLDRYEADMKHLNGQLASLTEVQAERELRHFSAYQYLNVHKQLANRVLEPYMWHTVITTGTEWSNFFALRNNKDAQPEIATIARMMQEDYDAQSPRLLAPGEWHLPLLQPDEVEVARADPERWAMICAARCARVSYLTHAGIRDPQADADMAAKLSTSGHMSPFEHVGYAMGDGEYAANPWSGKFHGFVQLRKRIPNEHDFALVVASKQ